MDITSTTTAAAAGTLAPSHSTFQFTPPGLTWTPKPTPTPSAGATNGMASMAMMGGTCRIAMLWNWFTIDACFFSESWQIKSRGGFAGLCIGVILLVIFREMLSLAAKTYDRHLIRRHQKTVYVPLPSARSSGEASHGAPAAKNHGHQPMVPTAPFRPNIWQQAIRALLHTLQFIVSYWIMLLAMYYNGYIIICIIIGAFIGAFVFRWERIGHRSDSSDCGVGAGVSQQEAVPGCHG